MTIEIENLYGDFGMDSYEEVIHKVVNAALDHEKCPFESQVYVLLTDNKEIHEINLQHREIDRPTDVLSFPLFQYSQPADFDQVEQYDDAFHPDTGELMLGDIIISIDKVKEQAQAYGHSQVRELAFLIAHSMLHLMGYDHMVEEERIDMEARQESILKLCGYTRI